MDKKNRILNGLNIAAIVFIVALATLTPIPDSAELNIVTTRNATIKDIMM